MMARLAIYLGPGLDTRVADPIHQGVVVEKKLDITNTLTKFLLDQSLGAGLNTIAFLIVVTALKGGALEACVDAVRTVRSRCYTP